MPKTPHSQCRGPRFDPASLELDSIWHNYEVTSKLSSMSQLALTWATAETHFMQMFYLSNKSIALSKAKRCSSLAFQAESAKFILVSSSGLRQTIKPS